MSEAPFKRVTLCLVFVFVSILSISPFFQTSLAAAPQPAEFSQEHTITLPPKLKAHYDAVQTAVDEYIKAGRVKEAEKLLIKEIAAWDLLTHSSLIIAARQKLEFVRTLLEGQQRADTQFNALETAANRYIDAGNLEQAKQLLEDEVKTWDSTKDIEQINKVNEMLKLIDGNIGFEASIGEYTAELRKAGWVLFQIGVYFTAVYILVIAIRWLRGTLRKRPGVGINLLDQSVTQKEQLASSEGLSLMLGREIRAIEQEDNSSIDVIGVAEACGVEIPLGEVAKLKEFVDETPVKVGLVSFSPRQIFSYIARFFEPQYEYLLMGALTSDDNQAYSLWVEKRKRDGTPLGGRGFQSSATGSNARQRVVRDVAIQFALANASSAVTTNWKSLREFLNAEELLAGSHGEAGPEAHFNQAFRMLKQSLSHDPANWMARFSAATLLRRLGRNREAADQYAYLLRMMRSRDLAESTHFQALLNKKPDFERTVRYRYAISLAQSRDYLAGQNGAFRILCIALNEIRKLMHIGSAVANKPVGFLEGLRAKAGRRVEYSRDQKRKLILARSARTIVRTEVLELLREKTWRDGDSPKLALKRDNQLLGIKSDEKWIWNQRENIDDWQAYARAHSSAQNALGRAYYIIGNNRMAIKFLRWSNETHLPETFADPLINLAVVYLNARHDRPIDWCAQARHLLEDALTISPSNTKAHYLLARIYTEESEYEKALEQYELAGDHAQTLYNHAKLLLEFPEKDRLVQALKLLHRSIEFEGHVDERYVLYAQIAVKAAEEDCIELRELKRVFRYAQRIVKKGVTDQLKKTGTQLVEHLERAIERKESSKLESNLFDTLDRLLHKSKQDAVQRSNPSGNISGPST